MVITLHPELEAALKEQARRQGVAPEALALDALRERFLAAAPPEPRDEWSAACWRRPGPGVCPFPTRPSAAKGCTNNVLPDRHQRPGSPGERLRWQHGAAGRAMLELHRRGERLHVTAQVLIEFRNVATRPKAMNGVGLPIVDAEAHAAAFESRFPLLAETPDVYPAWKALVQARWRSSASKCMTPAWRPSAMSMACRTC